MQYLNFKEVSEKLNWPEVLDWLNVSYEDKGKEIRTEDIVISKQNKLFFYKKDGTEKGKALGIINYVADQKNIGLRKACEVLISVFLKEHKDPERAIPELSLHYTAEVKALGLTEETCQRYEIGMVKQRSIMAGKIAFKLYDDQFRGYIGKEVKKDGWFYPKGFRRNFLYNGHRISGDYCIAVPDALACVRICQLGFPYTVATLGLAPTAEQVAEFARYRRILLIHPSPGNTLLRLSGKSFIKACEAEITKDTTQEQIKNLFK